MTIKVGDKVKIIREYSYNEGKEGIVVIIPTKEEDGSVFIDRHTNCYIEREQPIEQQLELVEVAHYIPVPKFKIGDVIYYNTERKNKYLILEERGDDLRYRCWFYTIDADVFVLEEDLTKEK